MIVACASIAKFYLLEEIARGVFEQEEQGEQGSRRREATTFDCNLGSGFTSHSLLLKSDSWERGTDTDPNVQYL